MQPMWGIHNDVFGRELIEGGFVSIGWDEIPDVTTIGPDREAIKAVLRASRDYASEGAVRNAAGVLYRFAFEMADGDLVVAPNKADGTLGFGRISGPYTYDATVPTHRHRRAVTWIKTGVARDHFSSKALNEVGSAITLFRVATHDHEFREFIEAAPEDEHLFRGDRFIPKPGDPVRYDLAVHAALQTLAELGTPVPRGEVMSRVAERLRGQFTPYEEAPFREGDPAPRWQNGLAWGSTDMKGAGWIEKTPAGWLITELGREVLAAHPDGDGLAREASLLYRAKSEGRPAQTQPRYMELIDATLRLIPEGQWSSYTEVAHAVGTNAQTVGWYMGHTSEDGAHRILGHDGKPSPGFVWPQGSERDGSQRDALELEGVRFDEWGRADEAQRVRTGDLRAGLEDMGLLAPPERRAWLVKASQVEGHDLFPEWREEGYVSLRASKLRWIDPEVDRETLKKVVDEDYAQSPYAARAAKVDEFDAFLTRMQPGDLVVTTRQSRVYVGTVTGDPEFVRSPGNRANLRRSVTWADGDGTDQGFLTNQLKARLNIQLEVVDLSAQYRTVASLFPDTDLSNDPATPAEDPEPTLELPDATPHLAESLHVDEPWLQECIDLLRDRPQLIFYGPPGTGKTFLATALAEHLAGDNVRLVQFHPAYSYEDFFEGYRPESGGGFELRPGPLRKTVDAARENPATAYFLIIDEINRGNLAKIFGELYFLLEYRDRNVDLLYATEDSIGFSLPENVFIIGTMNTADRSIALVDAAMRRRFAFVPLHPSETPTKDVLRRWLAANRLDAHVADLHDELNRRIDDPDFKIGPSYFMRQAVHAPGGLERAWRTAILPLLEEHHFGDGTDVAARYGLRAIRGAVSAARESSPEVAGEDPSDPA